MASNSEFECLEEEVKELLRNYKFKKATVYEPCTSDNFVECLIGLREEFDVLNINYVFNPYTDVEKGTLRPDALVKLVNALWSLLHYHKNAVEKGDRLLEQNHVLEDNNKQLNGIADRLKMKLNVEKNEARACVASAQRVSDSSKEILQTMKENQVKLVYLSKQKEACEKKMQNEINRLKWENEKLTDRLRNKNGAYTCCDICKVKQEDTKKKEALIKQLQLRIHELLREIVGMKEELILTGVNNRQADP